MGYKNAENILPSEILELVQQYVDGEILYIPRKDEKRCWGSVTETKARLQSRNQNIYMEYLSGKDTEKLATDYYLSRKSIQRIIRECKA